MHNLDGHVGDAESEKLTSTQASESDDWAKFRDNDIMQQQSAIQAEEAEKFPFVGDKEPLSSLAAEYKSGSPILLEKIKPVQRSRDQSVSDYVVMFFRFVTSGEIRKRSEFFEPFILGLTNASVEQFCKSAVEPMGEESDHVHITTLSNALGVPIRVVYLDCSSCDNGGFSVNHHDFIPVSNDLPVPSASPGGPEARNSFITLLYHRPGHYDILYP